MPEPDGEPRTTRVQRRATRTRRRELGSDPTKAAVRLLPPAAPTCWRLSVKARPGPDGTKVRSDPARRRPLHARSAARAAGSVLLRVASSVSALGSRERAAHRSPPEGAP